MSKSPGENAKNRAAAELGRLGGRARAKKFTREELSLMAKGVRLRKRKKKIEYNPEEAGE